MMRDSKSIPKIIHYCWFGGKKKPNLVVDCILSWKEHLSNYEFREWNEKNANLSHPFVKEMMKRKKWAFVSDYVRLDVLDLYGGIYLDTDMMVIKNFDDLLDNKCFFGAEDENYISCGVIGSIAHFDFINECKLAYHDIDLCNTAINDITIPKIVTDKFRKINNFTGDFNQKIIRNQIKIYPPHFFYPLSINDKNDAKNYRHYAIPETYMVHLWSSSWVENSEFQDLRNAEYTIGFKKIFEKLKKERKLKLKYIRKIASALKESFLKK